MSDQLSHLTGAQRISEERSRQVALGRGASHDDDHDKGELLMAAQALVGVARLEEAIGRAPQRWELDEMFAWPWMDEPPNCTGDPIRTLDKAGALIAAEIDRLQRAAPVSVSDPTPED